MIRGRSASWATRPVRSRLAPLPAPRRSRPPWRWRSSVEGRRGQTQHQLCRHRRRLATACYGHTGPDVKPGQVRTDAQCETLLREDARAHMGGALTCSPMLADHPNQLAAVTRLTFNIGVTGYCRPASPATSRPALWRPGCDRFLAFRYAGGREVRGLLLRRQRERALCLTGLPRMTPLGTLRRAIGGGLIAPWRSSAAWGLRCRPHRAGYRAQLDRISIAIGDVTGRRPRRPTCR